MSTRHLERAVHRLAQSPQLAEGRSPREALAALVDLRDSPAVALSWIDLRFQLEPDERHIIERGDVAEMYRRGVHPLVIRLFAGLFEIDYVKRYEEAGLR